MNQKRIKQIQKRVGTALRRELSEKDSKALSDLANIPGWDVLKRVMETVILAHLQPLRKKESAQSKDLAMIGAMAIGRGLVVDEMEGVITLVENTVASKKADAEKLEEELEEPEEGEEDSDQ